MKPPAWHRPVKCCVIADSYVSVANDPIVVDPILVQGHTAPMRRTDRLFDLIQILRDGRLHRAQDMAQRLGVSVRTIWRDVATLAASGLPVEGERGVGYLLRAPITLPPMILNAAELEVLRQGIRLVAEGADTTLARAARGLATKIAAVTPQPSKPEPDDLHSLTGQRTSKAPSHLPILRNAIKARERLSISYIETNGRESHLDIRALHLGVSGQVRILAAYCEGRHDFRSFRVDRIIAVTRTGEIFSTDPAHDLAAWRASLTP